MSYQFSFLQVFVGHILTQSHLLAVCILKQLSKSLSTAKQLAWLIQSGKFQILVCRALNAFGLMFPYDKVWARIETLAQKWRDRANDKFQILTNLHIQKLQKLWCNSLRKSDLSHGNILNTGILTVMCKDLLQKFEILNKNRALNWIYSLVDGLRINLIFNIYGSCEVLQNIGETVEVRR